MKFTKYIKNLLAALVVVYASTAQATLIYEYEGSIDSCTGICGIFTSVGQAAFINWEAEPSGGSIQALNIDSIAISLTTPSGGMLGFSNNGIALLSSLTTDSIGYITGGSVTLYAIGDTTFIPMKTIIDFDAGTWMSLVSSASTGLFEMIASGSGALVSPIHGPGPEPGPDPEPVSVPESSTLVIFALGIIGLASRRFKKQS